MKKVRCAIYTCKSSEDGLEQNFNSLDAQFEACAAYIASQKHEGWRQMPDRYDDGGVSGGMLERPGLNALLASIDGGRVDMVVVYKIDRLTRSLADFAKLVEHMEAAECSFVSVTQSFNTSSSMGRLTLNMLLSFAQFEREVTAERIRDKITASKKKGLWMGGLPPLGYDPHPDTARRELIVNEEGARVVQRLFAIYLEAGCLSAAAKAATREGLVSKRRAFASGRTQGGKPFSRGQLHHLLTNPVYRGMIRHKDTRWPGQHDAIIDGATWEAVQTRLQAASARRRGGSQALLNEAPLVGKFRDENGDRLTPSHTQKAGRRIRYYVSNRLISARGKDGWRLPAATFEGVVARIIADHIRSLASKHQVLKDGSADEIAVTSKRAKELADRLYEEGVMLAASLIESGRIATGAIGVNLSDKAMAEHLNVSPNRLADRVTEFDAPFTCKRRGVEIKIVAGEAHRSADHTLVTALKRAHQWLSEVKAGKPVKTLASEIGCADSYIRRLLPLATLSPKIQDAILAGRQTVDLTLERLTRTQFPLSWAEQEERFSV